VAGPDPSGRNEGASFPALPALPTIRFTRMGRTPKGTVETTPALAAASSYESGLLSRGGIAKWNSCARCGSAGRGV